MNARVRKLREQSIKTKPYITPERAVLITEFYRNDGASQLPTPVLRALAFKHVLENKKICINSGELIVGERGSTAKETPTYPEICCHMNRYGVIGDQVNWGERILTEFSYRKC